jgi:hypothetical protein
MLSMIVSVIVRASESDVGLRHRPMTLHTVVSIHSEVVSLPEVLQTLVLPMPILANEAVLLHRPPATFRDGLTEKEADALISFVIFVPGKLPSKPFAYLATTICADRCCGHNQHR